MKTWLSCCTRPWLIILHLSAAASIIAAIRIPEIATESGMHSSLEPPRLSELL
ncbi:hypothetical protein BP00DRAFT_423367 [Aspergillus indologenus CBS 114.80]|uniref:Uncharacterized protein n=1 Tax=Aspergillus indologenus CBS 114.80 TaxID=1450541 RepID=A0A2V5IBR5_9EURO|nr:hypothetical protein BP00DRAFT_423367 [Aspergillus indologenus CBS 114.80]